MREIAIDFETFYIKDVYSVTEQGTLGYVRDSRFNPYLVSVCDGRDTWSGPINRFNWDAIRGARLLSHNRMFDQSVLEEMMVRGMAPADLTWHDWHCTASLTTFLSMRRDLLRATEFLLGQAVDKSYRTDANGKNWADIVADGNAEKVLAAGRVDAIRCIQFWKKFSGLWPQFERDLSDLTIRQGRRGAQIDLAKLDRYLVTAQTMLIQAESVLPWMARGKKPTSPKAVAEECRAVGIPCPPVKSKDGEEAYEEWAAEWGPRYKWVKAYTDYRVINKFIGILQTIKSRLDPNAIFSYDLLYFGAHTGRWSGGGGFNMQNMRKEPLYCDTDGWLITDEARLKEISKSKTLPDYVAHVLDVRSLFIARPGKKLIISDLSQIEPRVLAWVVGDHAMLQSMASGQSPYEAHARATMNWTGGELKKEDKDRYALAKARVLGLGYGCGWNKFITVAQNMAGIDITTEDPEFIQATTDVDGVETPCFETDRVTGERKPKMVSGYGFNSKRIVREYRESNPLIAGENGIWRKLDKAFRDSVGGDFVMKLPSGRCLRYPEVRQERKAVIDPENPKKWRHKTVFTALAFDQKRNAVVRQVFYGGLLCENLIQAISRDVFGQHCINLDRTSGVDVLWSVHDEAVNECDLTLTKRDVEQIMSHCPEWLAGCPIAAEAVEAPHYLK